MIKLYTKYDGSADGGHNTAEWSQGTFEEVSNSQTGKGKINLRIIKEIKSTGLVGQINREGKIERGGQR